MIWFVPGITSRIFYQKIKRLRTDWSLCTLCCVVLLVKKLLFVLSLSTLVYVWVMSKKHTKCNTRFLTDGDPGDVKLSFLQHLQHSGTFLVSLSPKNTLILDLANSSVK